MGYDLNKFVDIQDIPSHLRCSICSLVLQDPLQSPCEHSFCVTCITIHLQSTNHCPHHDEDSVSEKSDKKKSPLRKMSFRKIIGKPKDKLPTLKLSDLKSLPASTLDELNKLKVNCEFYSNGCREQLTLSSLGEHVKKCEYVEELKSKQSIEQSSLQSKEMKEHSSEETRVESNEMDIKQQVQKRKDSGNKSLNGEAKLVSEEEVGSDDFVVIPKNTNSTKSTESVQTNGSDVISSESKENVNITEETVEKKKKKKKKKSKAKKDDDAVSLDATSLKDVASNSEQGSRAASKESLAESEEIKRALRDAETKSNNLRLINNQLLAQIKQLKDEKETFNAKLNSQLNTRTGEVDELKAKLVQLEKENKSHQLRIVQLLDNNEQMNQFIITLRDEQTQLKERYNATLTDVLQISRSLKTCKQEVQ